MKTLKVPLFTTKTSSYYKIPPNHMDYLVHRNSTNLGRIPIRSSWMISLFRKKPHWKTTQTTTASVFSVAREKC